MEMTTTYVSLPATSRQRVRAAATGTALRISGTAVTGLGTYGARAAVTRSAMVMAWPRPQVKGTGLPTAACCAPFAASIACSIATAEKTVQQITNPTTVAVANGDPGLRMRGRPPV